MRSKEPQGHLKISIVTPSYNSAKYIIECIESVECQSYRNFEHLIIDGGSTDGTLDILVKYGHLVWISEPDEGQSDALNKGFLRASGDFILWLNSDDYLLPNALEKYAESIKKNPTKHFFYSNYLWLDEINKKSRIIKPYNRYSYFLNSFYGCYIPTSGSCFKRQFIKEVGFLSIEFQYKMDTDWFEKCKRQKVYFHKLNDCLSVFRYHGNNVSFREKKKKGNMKFSKQELESIYIKDRFFKERFLISNLSFRSGVYKVLWYPARWIYLILKTFNFKVS